MGKTNHIVHCRICKKEIDINSESDWIMPSKGWYYHKICYEDWKVSSQHTDEEWVDLIYDFIARDLKVSYDYHKCEAQRLKFIKQNKYTNKGIYFTLKYFYEIKKGDWNKGYGGLGIIPYVYKDATTYWVNQETKKRGTLNAIEQQILARSMRENKIITKKNPNIKSHKWNLEDI